MEMHEAPNCAICNAPAYPECPCESERLQIAVKLAEQRAMDAQLDQIRDWVITHARKHILKAFEYLTSSRKQAHGRYLSSLPNYAIFMQYSGNPPIHRAYILQLQAQISEAHAELKRGIDADWRASVLHYPEVLDYFYSLVALQIPDENSVRVQEPPFAFVGYADRGYDPSRLGKEKKKKRRDSSSAPDRRREEHLYAVGQRLRGPPPVPTPPVQTGGFRPPGAFY